MNRQPDLPLYRRALRRLLTPVSRWLALSSAERSFKTLEPDRDLSRRPRVFIIAIPGTEDLLSKNVASLCDNCRLCLVLNGYSTRSARQLAVRLNADTTIRLRTLPGFPVKHGTALTMLLEHAAEDFILLDADCFIRDPSILKLPGFEAREYLAAPAHPHFFNTNPVTGMRFPRTHFLIVNVELIRQVMARHRINAEKYVHAPRRLAEALAGIGYGSHNYPRSYLRHFDTLLLLMAIAHHDGLRVRWLPANASQLVHWKHHVAVGSTLMAGLPDTPDHE